VRWQYAKGLQDLGGGSFAWLQPDGSWGWSNAGLVTDGEASLLVDTLFDLGLTGEMLAAMRDASPAAHAIDVLVNTHANGDHCFGNELVEGAVIVASTACAEEMGEVPPAMLAALVQNADELGAGGAFFREVFGAFHFDGIALTPPTETFEGRQMRRVGDKDVARPYAWRRPGARAGRPHDLHRRHPLHRRSPDHVGGAHRQLDPGL
jgi:glyoxylase-like metal-dependent hydrolase (beta-lactamase superfamily II)